MKGDVFKAPQCRFRIQATKTSNIQQLQTMLLSLTTGRLQHGVGNIDHRR